MAGKKFRKYQEVTTLPIMHVLTFYPPKNKVLQIMIYLCDTYSLLLHRLMDGCSVMLSHAAKHTLMSQTSNEFYDNIIGYIFPQKIIIKSFESTTSYSPN